jgi:hypothetical protein
MHRMNCVSVIVVGRTKLISIMELPTETERIRKISLFHCSCRFSGESTENMRNLIYLKNTVLQINHSNICLVIFHNIRALHSLKLRLKHNISHLLPLENCMLYLVFIVLTHHVAFSGYA